MKPEVIFLVSNAPVCWSTELLNPGNRAFSQSAGAEKPPLVLGNAAGRFHSVVSIASELTDLPPSNHREISGYSGGRMMFHTPRSTRREPESPSSRHRGVSKSLTSFHPASVSVPNAISFLKWWRSAKSSTGSKRSSMRNSAKQYFARVALCVAQNPSSCVASPPWPDLAGGYRHSDLVCEEHETEIHARTRTQGILTPGSGIYIEQLVLTGSSLEQRESSCVPKQHGKSMWLERGIPTGPIVSNVS